MLTKKGLVFFEDVFIWLAFVVPKLSAFDFDFNVTFSLHAFARARACVCVCMCVSLCVFCVFIFFHPEGSFRLQDVRDILEGTEQRFCVMSINPGASAKFLHLGIWKCHISPPKTKNLASKNWRGNDMILTVREKMIYIDIGYKSAPSLYQKMTKWY